MKKLLILALLFVGCEEAGITTNSLTSGTTVTDTLYISHDTTIYVYDTLIVNFDTTITYTYDTTITIYDTVIVLDTLIINNTDCAGVESGTASIDDCGLCTGGTTGLGINYLMDCSGVCNGDAVLDNCGTCDSDASNDCVSRYTCQGDHISLELDIYKMNLYFYNDWRFGSNKLAQLSITNNSVQNYNSTLDYYIYYFAKINNDLVIEGETKNNSVYKGTTSTISNLNFNPYSIKSYFTDQSFLYDLGTFGHLLAGNYEIGIKVIKADDTLTYCILTLDSLYQIQ